MANFVWRIVKAFFPGKLKWIVAGVLWPDNEN